MKLSVPDVELWSVARPALYTLVTSVAVLGAVVDSVNSTIGVRDLDWTGSSGQ